MSNEEDNKNEIPVVVKTNTDFTEPSKNNKITNNTQEKSKIDVDKKLESKKEYEELSTAELKEQLIKEKQNLSSCEDKLKRSLADYQNLQKKTQSEIENGVNMKIDQFLIKLLQIYDDFIRAKSVLKEQKININGLESILKNMDSLLSEYGVKPIDSLGEIFNPNLHEAISIVEDKTLDDDTITKEIRKGYISRNRVIRPAIVEISKKSIADRSEGE